MIVRKKIYLRGYYRMTVDKSIVLNALTNEWLNAHQIHLLIEKNGKPVYHTVQFILREAYSKNLIECKKIKGKSYWKNKV